MKTKGSKPQGGNNREGTMDGNNGLEMTEARGKQLEEMRREMTGANNKGK